MPPNTKVCGEARAPQIPFVVMKARAMVKARVACDRCWTSIFEKCHIEPVWTIVGRC